MEAMDLLVYSKLKKDLHTDDLKTELIARGVADFVHPIDHVNEKKRNKTMTFTDMKNKLRELEIERVSLAKPNDSNTVTIAKKGFKKQSTAKFDIPNEYVSSANNFEHSIIVSNTCL